MTQRVARPMKFAAFISIIISVAVMLAACQGAVGPKGPKGDDGDKGDPGTTVTGPIGPAAFQARTAVSPTLINVDELVDGEGRALGSAGADAKSKTFFLDLAGYFVGGTGDNTYELVDADPGADAAGVQFHMGDVVVEAKVNHETGMLEYTLSFGTIPTDEPAYATGYAGKVTGTDDNDISDTATITIKLNRKPRISASAVEGLVNTADTVLLLGIMDGNRKNADGEDTPLPLREDVHLVCAKINECVLDVFNDDPGDEITISVEGMTQQGKAVADKVGWELTDSGAIKLIGKASTWVVPAGENAVAAHQPVTVKLKAVDSRKLETEASVLVNVDAAPTVTALGMSYDGSTRDVNGALTITTDVSGWFANAEGGTPVYTGTSKNTAIATITAVDETGVLTDDSVIITGVAIGQSTTITVTATEPTTGGLGQSVSIEFTVSVSKVGVSD